MICIFAKHLSLSIIYCRALLMKWRSALKRSSRSLIWLVIFSHATCIRYSGSLIMAATYGYEAQPEGDPIISCADEVIAIGTKLLAPERAILLATFPFRKCQTVVVVVSLSHFAVEYLPSWFPGAADRRLTSYCRKLARRVLDEPFEIAKEQFVCNSVLCCWCGD